MKKSVFFALFSAALGLISASAATPAVDCVQLSVSVKLAISAEQSKVLEIVSTQVAAAPGCACEIVKAAVEATEASPKEVAAIVESAATAAPEHMRLISQCAVAVAPDALGEVQSVLAKLDPNLGESSGTSAKGSKGGVASTETAAGPNPLDFPGQGAVGPTPGGPGGLPLIPQFPPVVIAPPEVSPN